MDVEWLDKLNAVNGSLMALGTVLSGLAGIATITPKTSPGSSPQKTRLRLTVAALGGVMLTIGLVAYARQGTPDHLIDQG